MLKTDTIQITPEILNLIARIDEFKGAWRAMGTLAPDRLSALRRVATIESIGSSTRIEGSKLSDRDVQQLLSNLAIKSFDTRDEQEVALARPRHGAGPLERRRAPAAREPLATLYARMKDSPAPTDSILPSRISTLALPEQITRRPSRRRMRTWP